MAVRIRENGAVVCAAMSDAEPGDVYVNDAIHYELSAVHKILVTEPAYLPRGEGWGGHSDHGLWWWRDETPTDAVIEDFYGR